jgi:putative transposase
MEHGSTDEVDTARAARWAEGCRRHEAIRQLVDRHKQPLPRSVVEDVAWELGVSRATLYRLIELYKTFGTVDVLQPGATGRKSGTWVLPKATEQIIEETIRNVYLKPTRPTLTHLVDCVHARCTEEGVALPHRRTVRARVKAIDIRVRGQRRGNGIGNPVSH